MVWKIRKWDVGYGCTITGLSFARERGVVIMYTNKDKQLETKEENSITDEQLEQAFMEGYMYAIQVLQENIVKKTR